MKNKLSVVSEGYKRPCVDPDSFLPGRVGFKALRCDSDSTH